MQEFGTIVGIEEVVVSRLQVNGKAGVANLVRIRASAVRGIIRFPKQRIARWADQLRRASGAVMHAIARADIRIAQARFEHGLHGGDGREQVRAHEGQLERSVSAP